MPDDTPRRVLDRCRECGASVLTAPGTLVYAARRLAAEPGDFWDLSTLKEPYRAEGKKTMGLEIWEQLGGVLPDWIIYPTGGGTGIVGMHKAFAELEKLRLIDSRRPRFVVVQMTGCAPIVRAFERGEDSAPPWENPRTEVWGLRVPRAIGDFLILRALRETGGVAIGVEEDRLPAITARASREEGFQIGPEGAAALAALADLQTSGRLAAGERVVVFQTGHPANYGS
jgi:threonine synthase